MSAPVIPRGKPRGLIDHTWVNVEAAEDFGMTSRQVEVLAGYAAGLHREDICRSLFLTVNTVRIHVRHAHQRLGVETSAAAVARCYDLGIFRPRSVQAVAS